MNISLTNEKPSVIIPMDEYDYYQENLWKIRSYDKLIKGLEHFNIRISFEVDRTGNYIGYNIKTQSDDWGMHYER